MPERALAKTVLVTGGAGFIGSHLVDRLIEEGYRVRILDNLDPQVHPRGKPAYLNPSAEFILGDVRDRAVFATALTGVDAVFHFAASVGTGQSMYQIEQYTQVNLGGLSTLLDVLVERGWKPKVIFPGSATAYGECAHTCSEHGVVFPDLRPEEQLARRDWAVHCPRCGRPMEPVPIPESQPLAPRFVYGLHKKFGEEMLRAVAGTYGIPYTILRFFNVYGPRQSLSNPYTGVLAVFSSRVKNGNPPVVIEDGGESRDFIAVQDVVEACVRTLESDHANGKTFNVGTGQATAILPLARLLIDLHDAKLAPTVTGEFRKNDFRHSMADISHIRHTLGFEPRVALADGLRELVAWSGREEATDRFEQAAAELRGRGLLTRREQAGAAVVTLNWNGFVTTVECVEALLRSTYKPLKIFVVDNGSANREGARLTERFGGKATVIETGQNLGVAGGNNAGLAAALADPEVHYVVVMNNDLIVEPQTVERLVVPAEVDPSVGMVAARMMNYFDRDQVDNLGIALTPTGLGYNRKSERYPVFCPCSGCGLYRADALRAAAMPDGQIWDNDFFAYVDELDVGFRIRMAGFTAAYAADAVAFHKDGSTSGGAASDFAIFHGHRNNLWFIVKDFPASLLLRNFPGILATQLGTFLLYARRRRLGVVVRAKWASLRGLPAMLRKRPGVQRRRRVPVAALEKPMIRRLYVPPTAT